MCIKTYADKALEVFEHLILTAGFIMIKGFTQ